MEKTKQKQEAIRRMKLLKLHENIIREFKNEGIVNLSKNGGFLFWLDNDQQAIVDDFESEHGFLVYHVIRNFTEFGELYALLYVSNNEDDWEYDREDIQRGTPFVYVKNVNDDLCSEFGKIGIQSRFGGLIRTE